MKRKKHSVFLICLAVFLLLFSIFLKVDSAVHSDPLKELKSFPAEAIGYFPYESAIPIQYIRQASENQYKRTRLQLDLPHIIFSNILFDEKNSDILIEVGWHSQTFFGGKEIYLYAINTPDEKEKIINFIQAHAGELFSDDFERKIRKIYIKHYDELCKNPKKSPYVGLQSTGVFEWIKDGKDPEAEWRKKYPAEEL